jgi:serine/threonine protein kinase
VIPRRKGRYRRGERIAGTQYLFVRELGAGAHGEVYEVEHSFLQARSVMKLLHETLVDRKDVARRMRREARMLAQLRHPNIVEVRDGGISAEETPRPYFVMEALSGMPLRALLDRVRGGVGATSALRLVAGILDGLHHAHRASVVHRDVKPDNVFLHRTTSGLTVPKILDFGIAHLLLGRSVTGRAFFGTPRYAAPEQVRGLPPSEATDVYAAGLLLFELLTGQAPYAGVFRMSDLAEAHQHAPPPRPSAFARDVPRDLDALVALLCAKDPARRPPSAFAAAVAVRDVRARLEARAQGSLHTPDFATEPSPMDDAFLVAPSTRDLAFETQRPAFETRAPSPSLELPTSRTIRMLHALPTAAIGTPLGTNEEARRRGFASASDVDVLATLPSAEHVPELARALRRATGPVDRAAHTHTAAYSAPPPRAANDTHAAHALQPAPVYARPARPANARVVVPSQLATTASTRRATRRPAALMALAAVVGASLAALFVLVARVPGAATVPASLLPTYGPSVPPASRALDVNRVPPPPARSLTSLTPRAPRTADEAD